MMLTPVKCAAVAAALLHVAFARPAAAQTPNKVEVYKDTRGFKLKVDGKDFMVFGMNWGYVPVGENYNYSLWTKDDAFIQKVLDREMKLLTAMGGNAIRQYVGIPAKWITYIYEKHGVYTVLNHALGRYGVTVDGAWQFPTNYADPRTRQTIRNEIIELVESYKNTPGLLMWLLGNENNYGLVWKTTEIEDLPPEEANRARAEFLYSLFGEAIDDIKARDPNHPVAIANGDLGYIDLIVKHCKHMDVMGSNVYRGYSSRDLFQVVKDKLDVPFMYTEFGADAYNAKEKREDGEAQAEYLRTLWQEIYEHSYGKGRVGNAIGGLTFQWSDGWWKYRQEVNLDVQDTDASWANDAYPHDFVPGENNMNEEWFGICAKSKPDENGFHELYPRAGYYVLQRGYELDPYAPTTTLQTIRAHWGGIKPQRLTASSDTRRLEARLDELSLLRLDNVRMELRTYLTDGRNLAERSRELSRFDHLESFYVDLSTRPSKDVTAKLSLNVLGNVPVNPIDTIFYENRGKSVSEDDEEPFADIDRLAVYKASVEWDETWFQLRGFFREGHYHWAYEGDFFNLYPEANYGGNVDLYNADVPIGIEVDFKRDLEGLKLAFGPELYWGANPQIIGKYERELPGDIDFAVIHQEEIAQRAAGPISTVIPTPKSRRTSLYLAREHGPFKLELGGLWAGTPLIGEYFERAEDSGDAPGYLNSGYFVFDDEIRMQDTFGAKGKLTYSQGPLNWYAQGAYKGLVAIGGADPTLTFTGWRLKESGQGNHYNVLSGFTYTRNNVQIAPNFLYQKPLVDPLPSIDDFFDAETGVYFPGTTPRNVLDDPFVVRGNQEQIGYELLLAYDPTPATFMWQFDNIKREDALLAASVDFVYRDYRQGQDANIGVFADGGLFAFPAAPPSRNLWEVNVRAISNPLRDLRVLAEGYAGRGQARGDDTRVINRYGMALRASYLSFLLSGHLKIDDWGPFDFHRDFNFTFPLQGMLDLSYGAVAPDWLYGHYTQFGVQGRFRTLDEFSDRYAEDGIAYGAEYQLLTYLNVSLY